MSGYLLLSGACVIFLAAAQAGGRLVIDFAVGQGPFEVGDTCLAEKSPLIQMKRVQVLQSLAVSQSELRDVGVRQRECLQAGHFFQVHHSPRSMALPSGARCSESSPNQLRSGRYVHRDVAVGDRQSARAAQ